MHSWKVSFKWMIGDGGPPLKYGHLHIYDICVHRCMVSSASSLVETTRQAPIRTTGPWPVCRVTTQVRRAVRDMTIPVP